jgi:predicted ABC-class ATPase
VTDTVPKFRLTKRNLKNNTFLKNIESTKQDQELRNVRMANIVNIERKTFANVVFSDP